MEQGRGWGCGNERDGGFTVHGIPRDSASPATVHPPRRGLSPLSHLSPHSPISISALAPVLPLSVSTRDKLSVNCVVSALREHPRKPGRYELEIDGSPTRLPVSRELIAELKRKPGRELSPAELTRLHSAARVIACYDKALATLGARARSAADLARYLRTKEFTDAEIAPAIEKLQGLGLLDDREFARSFARSRLAPSRGYGPRRVAMELARKGVARAIVDEVLAEHEAERVAAIEANDADKTSAAGDGAAQDSAQGAAHQDPVIAVAQRKLRSMSKLEPEVRRRRLYGFLARRGFSGSEIGRALRLIGRDGSGGETGAGAEMEIGE